MPEPAPTDAEVRAWLKAAERLAEFNTTASHKRWAAVLRALLAERAELVTTKARLDTLQNAVEFYADKEGWRNRPNLRDGGLIDYSFPIWRDAGEIARGALARIGESPEQETPK
jgi:hypothetical protein